MVHRKLRTNLVMSSKLATLLINFFQVFAVSYQNLSIFDYSVGETDLNRLQVTSEE